MSHRQESTDMEGAERDDEYPCYHIHPNPPVPYASIDMQQF